MSHEKFRIPSPGKAGGPCRRTACTHASCYWLRADAERLCVRCGEAIGFDTPYVIASEGRRDFEPSTYKHAGCDLAPTSIFHESNS